MNNLIHGLVAHHLHNDAVILQGLDVEAGDLQLLSNKLLGSAQLLDDIIFGRQQLTKSGHFNLGCPQFVTVMVQVRHGEAVTPLQNSQGSAGVTI